MRSPPPNDIVPTPEPPLAHRTAPGSSLRFSGLLDGAAKQGSAIAGDILYGADAIAAFLFGEKKLRRRVYNLVDGNGLPVFRIGVSICARKSALLEWIAAQEHGSVNGAAREADD